MNRFMLEGLEHRALLSTTFVDTEPMLVQEAPVTIVRAAAAKAANYNCTGQMEGIAGKFVLKLAIAGTKVTGSIYSSSWGGFSSTVSGSLSAGKLSLTGKSTNFQLRSLKANMTSAGVISGGTWAGTQVGMKGAGTFTAVKATSVPAPAAAVAPKMAGTYKGKSYSPDDAPDNIVLTITRQSGGLVWGTAGGSPMSGFVLSNGKIYVMVKEPEGTTLVQGTYVAKTKKISGTWSWDGNDGDSDNGTFVLTRQ